MKIIRYAGGGEEEDSEYQITNRNNGIGATAEARLAHAAEEADPRPRSLPPLKFTMSPMGFPRVTMDEEEN